MRFARQEHGEGQQQKRLTKNGESHVDRAGALLFGVVRKSEQAIGRNAGERIDEIEGDKVTGDEDTNVAGHGEKPGKAEAAIWLVVAPEGGADHDPKQGSDREEHCAGWIEAERKAQ